MNVTLPENEKYSDRDKAIYITAIVVCIIAIIGVIIFEISANTSLNQLFNNSGKLEEKALGEKTDEEKEALKTSFDGKFTNEIEEKTASSGVKKIDNNKDIITIDTNVKESKPGSYEVNVLLPMINIDTQVVKEINNEIEQAFKNKLNSILKTADKNIVYSAEYTASIDDNVLSLMIRSNLKEGSNAQRTIIMTYNYNIKEDKKITLEELLNIKNLDKNTIQQMITSEIEKSEQRVESLGDLGYSIYNRNPKDTKYSINNSNQFYCTGNTIYIIYAYGNEEYTSEVDVVVI